jgi:hypothetical protein
MARRTSFPRLSEAEGLAHIASYLQSGLRSSEYQFYKWFKRYRSAHPELFAAGAEPPVGDKQFHEIRFETDSAEVSLPDGIEIHCPHGVKVLIPAGSRCSADMLSLLIKLGV